MPTAAVLSPHLDDAAFSCGGLMARLADADWQVVHATLFAATVPDPSGFALRCQLDKGIGADVDYMALRRDEDRVFAEQVGASNVVHGPFPEAPHRGYSSPDALFGPIRDDDSVVDPLCGYLRALLREHKPDLLALPQAIGGHVDHMQLVNAVGRVESLDTCPPLVWYRDAPYVIEHLGAHSPFPRVRKRSPLAVDVEPVLRQKLNGAAAYESQLGRQFARRFSDRDWAPAESQPASSRGGATPKEDQDTEHAIMRRALTYLAHEEAHRIQGDADGASSQGSLSNREGVPSAVERFRGNADAAGRLDALLLRTHH